MTVVTRCSSCRSRIWWAVTTKGKSMPIDEQPVENGNVVRTGHHNGKGTPEVMVLGKNQEPPKPRKERYVSHFATCPNRSAHRK